MKLLKAVVITSAIAIETIKTDIDEGEAGALNKRRHK
jgi:hypothetical protein